MKNRISKFWNNSESNSTKDIKRFFLACEFKPNSKLWHVLEPYAYDIVPAFTHGKLGILNYNPAAYSILTLDEKDELLLGYLMTITNPEGILLLDKIKGYNGENAFNTHFRVLASVYTDAKEANDAWCYIISPYVLNVYKQIEQVEWGMWEQDEEQVKLLERITEPGQ